MDKYKLGECATWNCKAYLVGDGKLLLKCSKCGRGYWRDEILKEKKLR